MPWHTDKMIPDVRSDVAHGVMPFISFKLPGPWSSFGADGADAWWHGLLGALAEIDSPVFLALHHEPENDTGSGHDAHHWVELQSIARETAHTSAPQVTVVPTLMQRTFDPATGRDPESWLVPDVPLMGIDVYNPWRPMGTEPWESFDTIIDRVRNYLPDTPLIIPEVGCREDPADPGRAALWFTDAFERCIRDDIVGMAYFDSAYNNDDGALSLDGARLRTWKSLLARREVTKPPTG